LNLKSRASVPNFQADGLSITAAESWFKVKVQLIQSYLQAFIMNASPKADEIIFVDLVSGSGLYSAGHQKSVFPGSNLTSLSLDHPFNRWLFFENDAEQATALAKRVKKYFPGKDVSVFNKTQAEWIQTLVANIQPSRADHKVAVICLIDSFSMEVPFSVVQKLSALGFSFLIPFTFTLNERFNCQSYCREHADLVMKYIGVGNLDRLLSTENNLHFYRKVVRMYQTNMLVLGLNSAVSSNQLDSKLMELPFFQVGIFSKQLSAEAIQQEVNVNEHLQFRLF
jgi:three-Cys-motif partner protein